MWCPQDLWNTSQIWQILKTYHDEETRCNGIDDTFAPIPSNQTLKVMRGVVRASNPCCDELDSSLRFWASWTSDGVSFKEILSSNTPFFYFLLINYLFLVWVWELTVFKDDGFDDDVSRLRIGLQK